MSARGWERRAVTAVGIIPSLVIGVREGIEAALVIGIILGYLVKIQRGGLKRYVYSGTMAAFLVSEGDAGALIALTRAVQRVGRMLVAGIPLRGALTLLP